LDSYDTTIKNFNFIPDIILFLSTEEFKGYILKTTQECNNPIITQINEEKRQYK